VKKKEKKGHYFFKAKNIAVMVYFILTSTIALLVLLDYFGVLEFSLFG